MMNSARRFILADQAVDLRVLRSALEDPAAGAVVEFEGRVRNHNQGKSVRLLEYQAYPALAHFAGERIMAEEMERHNLVRVLAVHRTGNLEIGEVAVWVGVASANRASAFDGARAILERLKFELPIWKKETYADGSGGWIGPDGQPAEGGALDLLKVDEWQADLEAIYLSEGHDFRGRHGEERLEHPVTRVDEVECVAGMGLRGDRYFGYKPDYKGQVTFFDAAVVDEIRREFTLPELGAEAFRRNLLVRGVTLGDWIGRKFVFQGILFEGAEECRPCYWMDQAVAQGAESSLKPDCRGGLRARVLSSGVLKVGGHRAAEHPVST
jgi:molybdopterin synthase catalytic subunit